VEQRFVTCGVGRRPALLGALREIGVARPSRGEAATARQRPRVLVFLNTIKSIRAVAQFLKRSAIDSAILHGQLSQLEREEALSALKSGKKNVLLCTDVAGRGVHISKLSAVVHFDLPASMREYVHRTGRTGRQGEAGISVALLPATAEARHFAALLVPLLTRAMRPLPAQLTAFLSGGRASVRCDGAHVCSGDLSVVGGPAANGSGGLPVGEDEREEGVVIAEHRPPRKRAKRVAAKSEVAHAPVAAFHSAASLCMADLLEFARTNA